jgi:hypothetical protein
MGHQAMIYKACPLFTRAALTAVQLVQSTVCRSAEGQCNKALSMMKPKIVFSLDAPQFGPAWPSQLG